MKVLIIARGYPSEKYRMNGIFEFDQAKALVKSGVDVIYAAVDVRSIRRWRKWGIEIKTIEGVKIYIFIIPFGRIPKPILRGISKIGLVYLYKRIIKEQGKPDVMHAHFLGVGYIASIIKKKYNIPFVLTEHWSDLMKPTLKKGVFKVAQTAYSLADKIIAVSKGLKGVIAEKFHKEAIYIPNIVDKSLFTYVHKTDENSFLFVSTGGLIYRKRMDLTIEAFIEAFRNNDKVSLTIFGEGSERQKLLEIIKANAMERRIKLMGLQSRKVISEYLKKSDCFVLASQAETFGVVYIEAMASGLPVIATKCGGPESFVNEENGIIVPVDNKEALIEAMKYMYVNATKYNKENISNKTKEMFSDSEVARQLVELYKEAISKYEKKEGEI